MVQWVKNLTAAARVPAEGSIPSGAQRVKGSRGCCSCSCGLDSVPGLGISTCHRDEHKKKKCNVGWGWGEGPPPEACGLEVPRNLDLLFFLMGWGLIRLDSAVCG